MLKLFALAVLVAFGTPADAFADVFGTVENKGKTMFEAVKKIVFVIGGFGMVGLAVAAIFGAIKWKWFAALGFGLAVVAAANAVVQYATNTSAGFSDTLS